MYRLYIVIPLIIMSCKQDLELNQGHNQGNNNSPLFRLVSVEESGIKFVNDLPETDFMNGFLYEYFYNGGGVAIGDVNNDGLEDIYFTSNLNDNKLYLNQGGLKFTDITDVANVAGETGWATGVSMVDINQDGLLDIYVCRSGAFTDGAFRINELFINLGPDKNGTPVFKESAAVYGLDDPSYSTQSAFFDYDLDGDLDMFLINHNLEAPPRGIELVVELHNTESPFGGNKLFKNNGNSFEDVTAEAGILSNKMNYTLGISISDINNDNWPDIYVANDYSEPDYLYINNGNGTFKNTTSQSMGHIPNASMGTDIADINNDGLQDIMSLDMAAADNYGIKTSMSGMNPKLFYGHVEAGLHHQYMYNALQLNNGNSEEGLPLFSEIGQLAGVSSTDWSWSPLLADFDNDSYKDLFITNGVKRNFISNDFNIFLNKEIQKIKDQKEDPLNHFAQLTQLAPTRKKVNYIYRNEGDLSFTNIGEDWGITEISLSNGAAYADLDNDGDLDLIVNNVDKPAFIYENLSDRNSNHHYLSVGLKGPPKNIDGIGAKVWVTTGDGIQVLEQYPTRGYLSSVSFKLHFGLGESDEINQVAVTWPDGKQQVLKNVEANQHLIINYTEATKPVVAEVSENKLFTNVSSEVNIGFYHQENTFDDFKREGLLPHKMSQMGPALAVSDVNGDGLEDFYIGGAMGYPGEIYFQDQNGKFSPSNQKIWKDEKDYEDVDALFFDADQDGDKDLFVVSGGNENPEGSNFYQSRLYENMGHGIFNRSNSQHTLPIISGSVVREADYDNDGDLDLFIGGRQKPGMYPFPVSSFLLRNDSEPGVIKFTDVTSELIPELNNIGMVTDASWTDLDSDGLPELIICGEWMGVHIYKYNTTNFEDFSTISGLDKYTGWWYSIASADFDNDGDVDIVIGNHGLNNKYKTSSAEPFQVYTTDFDNNGIYDIVLGYYNEGSLFPLRGRECTSTQMPFIKNKFTSYDAFGKATLYDVYGLENLSSALHYQVNTFATTYFENKGNLQFDATPLDNMAQISSVKCQLIDDYDKDGHLDIVLAGNMYETEVETPRNDASYGLYLKGDGKGNFESVSPSMSGLYVIGDVKKSSFIELGDGGRCILFAINGDKPKVIRVNYGSSQGAQLASLLND